MAAGFTQTAPPLPPDVRRQQQKSVSPGQQFMQLGQASPQAAQQRPNADGGDQITGDFDPFEFCNQQFDGVIVPAVAQIAKVVQAVDPASLPLVKAFVQAGSVLQQALNSSNPQGGAEQNPELARASQNGAEGPGSISLG